MRITRHHMFMKMAEAAAERSTCFRRAVGAILVHQNNVISIGYNGPPSGHEHCTGKNCPVDNVCARAVHAEINVFNRCPIHPQQATLYVTESPCPDCARRITEEDIDAVYFMHEYRIRDGINILLRDNIPVLRLTPSGYIIDAKSGDLVWAVTRYE